MGIFPEFTCLCHGNIPYFKESLRGRSILFLILSYLKGISEAKVLERLRTALSFSFPPPVKDATHSLS